MTKRSVKIIDKDLAEARKEIEKVKAENVLHQESRGKCLDKNPPDLDGAAREKMALDRGNDKVEAVERRVVRLEDERAAAVQLEAKAAHEAMKKGLENRITEAVAKVRGDSCQTQLEGTSELWELVGDCNVERRRANEKGLSFGVDIPGPILNYLQSSVIIDPENGAVIYTWKQGVKLETSGRKAA